MANVFNFQITERKLLVLSFLVIVILSIGLVQSFNSGLNPNILGHSAEELGDTCGWILDPLSGIPNTDARWIECNNAKTTAGANWNGDYTSVWAASAINNGGGGGGGGSSTVCLDVVGKDCTSLGSNWNIQGSAKETVDAIWCGFDQTLADDWWSYYGANQNLIGGSWGIGNSFSKDADLLHIGNPGPYQTSKIVGITPGGLNPVLYTNPFTFQQKGSCTQGVLSWRSTCCKTF